MVPEPYRGSPGSRVVTITLAVVLFISIASAFVLKVPWLPVYFGLILLVVIGQVVRARRQAANFVVESNEGISALAQGELQLARDIFWRWSSASPSVRISALARHNLAWTRMRQGELQHAIEILIDNESRYARALQAMGMYPTSSTDLALDHALLGDVTEAEKWLAESERRREYLSTPNFPAMKIFARAVLDCRCGRTEDAARLLEEHWVECEGTLTGETLRPLRVIRAFAIAAAGPRNAGPAEVLLAASRPAYPDEYTFLGKAWPEMANFLTSHRL
jgi:hypothetical protein